jgi:hypothetical protein
MPLWFFPVGLLGTVVLLSLATVASSLLAVVWGFVVFPLGAAYIRHHGRSPGGRSDENGLHDVDTRYWRTTLR